MDRNILLLGGMYPAELYFSIVENSKRGLQFAANNLQWSIVKGFECNFQKFTVLTAPFISTFPFGYRKLFFKGCNFFGSTYEGKCVSFFNTPIISFKRRILTNEILKWYNQTSGGKCIIIYSLINELMCAAIEVKKLYPDLVICQIVTDLPEFMNANKVYKLLVLKKRNDKSVKNNVKFVDSFVVLTSFMVDRLDVRHKPFLVLEGIYNSSINDSKKSFKESFDHKVILYTGALAKKYGILKLVGAFSLITDENCRLWICGGGECVDEIVLRSRSDERIKYWGLLPANDILSMQKEATVLVNPRPAGDQYTKYSFPSKTMEYLASGTPVVMYKLDGVPKEYFDFCFVPNDDSVTELKNTLQMVCSMSLEERRKFGSSAREYILNNKNHCVQTKKILNLIEGL